MPQKKNQETICYNKDLLENLETELLKELESVNEEQSKDDSTSSNIVEKSKNETSDLIEVADRFRKIKIQENIVDFIQLQKTAKDNFYKEIATPFSQKYDIYDKIPEYFESISQYFRIMNSLRIEENRATTIKELLKKKEYEKCYIVNIGTDFIIKTDNSRFKIPHLILFAQEELEFTSSADCEEKLKSKQAFLGLAINIEKSLNWYGSRYIRDKKAFFLTILVFENIPFLRLGAEIFYRPIYNLISSMREYQSLLRINEKSLFKFIMAPKKNQEQDSSDSFNDNNFFNNLRDLMISHHNLNREQADIVKKCIQSKDIFYLIQGPPGTGKTRLIMSLISCMLFTTKKSNSLICTKTMNRLKILVCSHSNIAVDNIAIRFLKGIENMQGELIKVNFVKSGSKTNPILKNYALKKRQKFKSNASVTAGNEEKLKKAVVVFSTLNSSGFDKMTACKFDYLIIDESCHASEISTLIPFKYNLKKIIMIGDPKQLAPTIFGSNNALQKSLFERLSLEYTPMVLYTQYRMVENICKIPSDLFYDSKLITASDINRYYKINLSLAFIELISGFEKLNSNKSFFNTEEAEIALQIAKEFRNEFKSENLEIIILTPYRGQADLICTMQSESDPNPISCKTIDESQGTEADVIIISTVRRNNLGFTDNVRRINVAITRAKSTVIILGYYKCLKKSIIWDDIINRIKKDYIFLNEKDLSKLFSMI